MKKCVIIVLLISVKSFSQINVDTSFSGFKIDYFPNNNPKKKVEYKKGKPCGLVMTYHENGTLNETGIFLKGKWLGEYKFYYPNGQAQQSFNFDSNGKRVGYQRTYYENGLIQIIAASYNNGKDGYSLTFDTLGKLIGSLELQIDGQIIYKNDKGYDNYKGMQEALLDIVNRENEVILRKK
jgi:antitoxin component YwqK of YwqJK toxin-antitoxin module